MQHTHTHTQYSLVTGPVQMLLFGVGSPAGAALFNGTANPK